MEEVQPGLLERVLEAVAGPADASRVLSELAAVLVPASADWCLADLLTPPDLVTRVVALGRDGPLVLPPDQGGVEARRSSSSAVGVLAGLVDAPGRPLRLTAADLAGLADAPDERTRAQADLARSLGSVEVVLLGLTSRAELLGVLVLGRTDRAFTDDELRDLTAAARLTGLALDGARVREAQRGVSAALQRSLLPQLPVVPGLSLAARFAPADAALAVGGDWYDAFALPDGRVAVVVGDATGHDVQAATRMAELRTLLRALAVDRQEGPARTLSRLDRAAAHLGPELSGTCVYLLLDLASRTAQWSSAGHLPPVLLRDGRAALLETRPDLMLGVRERTERHDHALDLRPGDLLVLCTDGLVEDRRSGLDQRLEDLRQAVELDGALGPEAVVDRLLRRMASGEDDVAVLAVRVDGA